MACMPVSRILLSFLVALAMTAIARHKVYAAEPAAATPQYVAMGSSYAAGPGITPIVPGSPIRCARSAQNYAHVLASARGLSLVDATCSGATTVDVLQGGQFGLPPQLDAVTAATQLVTVTIGGNDVFFMGNLIAMSCSADTPPVQRLAGGCTLRPDALVETRFASLPDSLRQVVAGVHQRSPSARVVFVNYFTVLPEQGTCARVALTSKQADHVRGISRRLADITRQVARATGSGLLDLAALSRAHNACASDPWVLGALRQPGLSIPPFHPTQEAMHAVGVALNSYLASQS